jgi:hypothetical protein
MRTDIRPAGGSDIAIKNDRRKLLSIDVKLADECLHVFRGEPICSGSLLISSQLRTRGKILSKLAADGPTCFANANQSAGITLPCVAMAERVTMSKNQFRTESTSRAPQTQGSRTRPCVRRAHGGQSAFP